jgi:hypothetical protein
MRGLKVKFEAFYGTREWPVLRSGQMNSIRETSGKLGELHNHFQCGGISFFLPGFETRPFNLSTFKLMYL